MHRRLVRGKTSREEAFEADKLTGLHEEYQCDLWPTNDQYGCVWTSGGTPTGHPALR